MSQDIYRTRERERRISSGPDASAAVRRGMMPPPRARSWAVFLTLALLLFLMALGAVVFLQQRLIQQQKEKLQSSGIVPESAASPGVTVAPPAPGAGLDPAAQAVLDDLIAMVVEDLPPTERPPLTGYWLQQAAFQLRQAELAYRRGAWSQAATAYRQALRIVPEIADGDARLGLCLMRESQFADAERSFRRAIELQPKVAAHYNNLGAALMGQGRAEEAEAAFRQALELNPNHLAAARNLALLKFRGGDMAAAAAAFREFLVRAPDDFDATHMLAVSLIRTEQWGPAVALLQESARRWPDIPPVRFRLAQALAASGMGDQAMAALREGVGLIDPGRALVWLSRSDFDRLRDRPDFQELIQGLPKRPR